MRLESLAQWCGAFLAGFGVGGAPVGEEAEEIVNDFVAISQVDAEIADGDDAEHDLIEIAEFVKVGVLLLGSQASAPEGSAR